MLSQIERGKVNPTFAVVWTLTQALGVNLSDLNQEGKPDASHRLVDHMAAYSTPVKRSADGKVELRLLSPYRTILPVEWYWVVLEPKGALISPPHASGAYEHLTCLRGEMEVDIDDKTLALPAGDTMRYDADQPHAMRNIGTTLAEALLVVGKPEQYG